MFKDEKYLIKDVARKGDRGGQGITERSEKVFLITRLRNMTILVMRFSREERSKQREQQL